MAISVIGATAPTASSQPFYYDVEASVKRFIPLAGVAGIYTITVTAKDFGATPTGSIDFISAGNTVVTGAVLSGTDSGSGNESAQAIVRVTGDFKGFTFSVNSNAWLTFAYNNAFTQGTLLVTTTYTTSQSITIVGTGAFALLGGGGGGGSGSRGGGGGSGYLTIGSITSGTHSLVVGAGGAESTAGGSSTYRGSTALGGQPGGPQTGVGGAGGSGGGGGGFQGGNGGTNGSNGNNGVDGGPAAGGAGSGVAFPSFIFAFGNGGGNSAPGGLYGGGGGGAISGGGAGGAGGGGFSAGSGKSGGNGGLIILTGL